MEEPLAQPAAPRGRWKRVARTVGAGLAVLVLSFVWLDRIYPADPPVLKDAAHALLAARDCLENQQCLHRGQVTSVPGVVQGAVWDDLVLAVSLLGGGPRAIRAVILLLLALGNATVFVVARRWLGGATAVCSAMLLLAAYSSTPEPAQLVHQSVVFAPDALGAAALFVFAMRGQRRFLVAAAFLTALAVDTHAAAACLVPALMLVAGVATARPVRDVVIAAACFVGTELLTSRAALTSNLQSVLSRVPWFALLGGLVGYVVLVWLLRRLWNETFSRRAIFVGVAQLLPYVAATAWVLSLANHTYQWGYYWHPVAAPAAVLGAYAMVGGLDWLARDSARRSSTRSLAVVASCVVLLWQGSAALERAESVRFPPWSFEETKAVADVLAQRGWSFEQMLYRTQGRGCLDAVSGLAVFAPPPSSHVVDPFRHVQLRRASSGADAEPGEEVVRSASGGAVLLREVRSWVDFGAAQACVTPPSGERTCVRVAPAWTETLEPGRFVFAERTNTELYPEIRPPPFITRLEVPIRAAPDQRRVIEVLDDAFTEACRWRIVGVEGVTVEGTLPGSRVTLAPGGGGEGRLVFEKAVGMAGCESELADHRYPPCLLESTPSDAPGPSTRREP